MANLSTDTKARVRYHLSYPMVESGAYIEMQGAILTTVDATNRLEYAMEHVREGTEAMVLRIIGYLDSIEKKMSSGALCRLQASSVDEIDMNPNELDELSKQYISWAKKLADLFSCKIYPGSYMSKVSMTGTRNLMRVSQ